MDKNLTKNQRLQIRLSVTEKDLLTKAAHYKGQGLSEFILGNVVSEAERVIDEQEKVAMTSADWEVFWEALENPPKPNKALKKAFQQYMKSHS